MIDGQNYSLTWWWKDEVEISILRTLLGYISAMEKLYDVKEEVLRQ